jgi:PAS domain S-box-containing protein
MLGAVLSFEGFTVLEAGDGEEASRIIEAHPVDVIVSDILMPKMDGYRLCTIVRQRESMDRVPFLFHTSTYTSPSDETLALSLGADQFIRKPVAGRVIVEAVRAALDAPRPSRPRPALPQNVDLTAEYTQRLVEKLEEKNEELYVRTREARGSSDKLAALILAAPIGIISFDAAGIIRTWNTAAEGIFRWNADGVVGRTPDELGMFLGAECKLSKHVVRGMELTLRRRDGTEVNVTLSVAPLHNPHGAVSGWMAVFADNTERTRAEAAVEKAKGRMETLSRQLLATGEAALRRIARELHDEIGQGLTAAKMAIESAKLATDPASLALRLDDASAMIDQLLNSVRALSLDLRPASLDELGLVAALRAHLHAQAARAGLRIQFETDELPPGNGAEGDIVCFRVAQEALTNVIRHANATSVEVELRRHPAGVRLVVKDDGIGFNTALAHARAEQGMSFGLLSMRERTELAGGRFLCVSDTGRGTRIEIELPW